MSNLTLGTAAATRLEIEEPPKAWLHGAIGWSVSSAGDWHIRSLNFEPFVAVVGEIVRALVQSRDSLSLQLSHAKGLVDAEEFERAIEQYLREPNDVPGIEHKVAVLNALLLPGQIDSELVAAVFGCSDDAAESALVHLAGQLELPFGPQPHRGP